jgi:hypothetical protein
MDYGFITGLPRSGSAWIANYLSYGDTMVLHDAWKSYAPDVLKVKFSMFKDIKAGGAADAGNLFLLSEIDKEFPDAKWVLITRPQEEIEASCKNIKFPLVDFTQRLKILINSREVLKVPFKEMFDRADEIGRYIHADFKCPSWRKSQLKILNVQLNWGRVSDQFQVPQIIKEVDTLTPNKMAYFKLVREICNDDPHAVRFLAQARDASELYRRLNEKKPIDIEKAKETLEAMATEWLVSPFLRNFSQAIAPAVMAALEKYQNEKDLEYCPIDIDLLTVLTYIFRGNEGVKEYMPKVRELSDKILKEKVT